MKTWKTALITLQNLFKRKKNKLDTTTSTKNANNQDLLAESSITLQALLNNKHIPKTVKLELTEKFEQLDRMIKKLADEQFHIAVFGRVSVGKSALINALIKEQSLPVSPLHGSTQTSKMTHWQTMHENTTTLNGIFLIDTPGIDEIDGASKEKIVTQAASYCDLLLFIVDGDITATELKALQTLATYNHPILLILNKADLYTKNDLEKLKKHLVQATQHIINPNNICTTAADPKNVLPGNTYTEPSIKKLTKRIWHIIEEEGKTLIAVNSQLLASNVSEEIASRVASLKQEMAKQIIKTYCLGKGIAIAINPIPVADLLAAASVDIALIVHLGKVYGFNMNKMDATRLITTISAQLIGLMGAVWGINLVASLLKGLSAGLSTIVTAGAQGILAYYATYLVGIAAQHYFIHGKSWGKQGPKQVMKRILKDIDQHSILYEAKQEIFSHLNHKLIKR